VLNHYSGGLVRGKRGELNLMLPSSKSEHTSGSNVEDCPLSTPPPTTAVVDQ